jgi:histidinol phosphatase-like enzyme
VKILFLDIDGVLNSEETLKKNTRGAHEFHGVVGIDPYLALLVNRIIEETGCEVVLSSSWRGSAHAHAYIEMCIGHKLKDITPRCCTGIRGVEIYRWIQENIPHTERDALKYAILDDDSDMLLWQKDNFFQTSFKTGITEEMSKTIIAHLNG